MVDGKPRAPRRQNLTRIETWVTMLLLLPDTTCSRWFHMGLADRAPNNRSALPTQVDRALFLGVRCTSGSISAHRLSRHILPSVHPLVSPS